MKSHHLALGILLLLPFLSTCKERGNGSSVKGTDIGNGALDVNDATILFPQTGPGVFYPNIPIET